MPKIAMIGAGSMIFTKTLSMDILATPALRGSELALMSRTRPKLDRMKLPRSTLKMPLLFIWKGI